MTRKVLVTGSSVSPHLLEPLLAAGFNVDNPKGTLSQAELRKRLRDADAYLLGGEEDKALPETLADATKLKLIAFLGVGFESFIDVASATSRGIKITNTPGVLTQSVAEYAIGQMINAVRGLGYYGHSTIEAYRDNKNFESVESASEIDALGVGLIGFGQIGTRVAEILRFGFNCRVSYWSRTRKITEENRLGVTYGSMEEVISRNRIVMLMVPGNTSTAKLINDRVLNVAKDLILINISKSGVIDPASLLSALRTERVKTASFDHFYELDVPERSELIKLDPSRLLVTPHIGSLTKEARDRMGSMSVQSILNFFSTGSDPNIVN